MYRAKSTKRAISQLPLLWTRSDTPYVYAYALSYEIKFGGNKMCGFCLKCQINFLPILPARRYSPSEGVCLALLQEYPHHTEHCWQSTATSCSMRWHHGLKKESSETVNSPEQRKLKDPSRNAVQTIADSRTGSSSMKAMLRERT